MRRTWLFVPGADEAAQSAATRSGADVLIQELEDFTPPALRPQARALAGELYGRWRKAGALAAVRVNPLETCGREDLAAALAGKPDIVLMSKVESPEQVRALAEAAPGVELVPNIESARGLLRVQEIARASPQVTALRARTWWPTSAPHAVALARSSHTCASAFSSNAAPPAWKRSTRPTPSAT